MLAHFARRSIVELEPYAWEAPSTVIAARHNLHPNEVLRFDLNTVVAAPPSWRAPMTAARDDDGPQEYADPTYSELTQLLGDYCGVDAAQVLVGAGADEILSIICQTFLEVGDAVVGGSGGGGRAFATGERAAAHGARHFKKVDRDLCWSSDMRFRFIDYP